jgi:hypothetical protein
MGIRPVGLSRYVYVRCCMITGLVALAQPALAQIGQRFDVSGGYSFMSEHASDVAPPTVAPFPVRDDATLHGWAAGVTGYLNERFGIAAEVGGNYREREVVNRDVKVHVHTLMFGSRFVARSSARLRPFGRVMAGVTRLTVLVDDETESENHPALDIGGGIDWHTSDSVGLRIGLDYRRVFRGDTNAARLFVGVVTTIGRR